ncbi:MAG: hypothetical protein V1494_03920 [Candidatus Diapherotrites archaeon]
MSAENAKHLSREAMRNQLLSMQKDVSELSQKIASYIENFDAIIDETYLGKTAKLADVAFEIIRQAGKFNSYDCAKLGLYDSTQKKRLFTALKQRYPEVKTELRQNYGDKRKILVAWLDEKKLNEIEKDPVQDIKEFVQASRPSREQLISKFGWSQEEADQKGNC